MDVQAITIRVKNNSQFSESRKWLEDHSINSDREEKQKSRSVEKMKSILPVLHLLRSLVIKSGHMATVCIGEGEKPTQASLTQVMT